MTIDELNKQTEYNATEYVNDSAPDIDAEHLNKNEQKLKETVQQANNIIDTLKALISDVQTESSSTVPSSSLVYQMQQQIDSISQGGVSGDYIKKSDISNVQVDDQNKVPSSALAYSMQQQINEANSNLENLNLDWKLIGTVTGQSPITLPEQFEQLLIKMEHNNVIYSVYALKNWLSSTAKTFRTGYGMSDGNYSAYIGINVSLTQATLEAYKVGNVVNTNSTSVTAYYR